MVVWIGLIRFTIKSTLSTGTYGRSNLPSSYVKGWKYLYQVADHELL
jgi:hypothetical protein